MFCVCEYNPDRDVMPVSQFGFVDIVKANATSKVDVVDTLSEDKYNNIDDPRSIGMRPSDDFEAAQAANVIFNFKPNEAAESSNIG